MGLSIFWLSGLSLFTGEWITMSAAKSALLEFRVMRENGLGSCINESRKAFSSRLLIYEAMQRPT